MAPERARLAGRAAHPGTTVVSAPLPADWSPVDIWHALYLTAKPGAETRRRLRALEVQRSIDDFKSHALPPVECDCDPDDPDWHYGCVPEEDAIALDEVLAAIQVHVTDDRQRVALEKAITS
jgi:hypothetical protein